MKSTTAQEFVSRIGGLERALDITLRALAVACRDEARPTIEMLRDKLVDDFKNSDISAEREMDHASVVAPAIDAITIVFDRALRNLE